MANIDLQNMTNDEIADALINDPSLSEEIDKLNKWKDFNSANWLKILVKHPIFWDKCNIQDQFTVKDWVELIIAYPPFINDKEVIYDFTSEDWERIVNIHKELWTYSPDACVQDCIKKTPRDLMSEYSSLNYFRKEHWFKLLKARPQYIHDYLAFYVIDGRFSSSDWDELIKIQPKLKKYSPKNVVKEMIKNPQIPEFYDISSEFTEEEWSILLKKHPQFINICPSFLAFNSRFWVDILVVQPSLAKNCRLWSKEPDKYWQQRGHLDFEQNIEFSINELEQIMKAQPTLWIYSHTISVEKIIEDSTTSGKCVCWGSFTTEDWFKLLMVRPEFHDKCPDEVYMSFDNEMKDKLTLENSNLESRAIFMRKFLTLSL